MLSVVAFAMNICACTGGGALRNSRFFLEDTGEVWTCNMNCTIVAVLMSQCAIRDNLVWRGFQGG